MFEKYRFNIEFPLYFFQSRFILYLHLIRSPYHGFILFPNLRRLEIYSYLTFRFGCYLTIKRKRVTFYCMRYEQC